MDKYRFGGADPEITGSIKEAVGKVTGDEKVEAEGKAEKLAGKKQAADAHAKGRRPTDGSS